VNEVAIKEQQAPKLRPGPLALYVLFCQSVDEKRILSRAEIFAVYKRYVAAGVNDKPRRNSEGQVVWIECPWTEWEWQRNFEGWFVYTLGALLKKGYLRVVPAIDLARCDTGQLQDKGNCDA
jgi:hypothetical protein